MILASFGETLLAFFIILLSLLLIGLVLLQKNKGGGLSGAFGGVGGYSAFGTKTGDFLTWVTVGVTAAFLLTCVVANWVFVPDYTNSANAAPTVPAPGPTAPRPNTPRPPGPVAPGPVGPTATPPAGAMPNKPMTAVPTGPTQPAGVKPMSPGAATPNTATTPPPSTQPGK